MTRDGARQSTMAACPRMARGLPEQLPEEVRIKCGTTKDIALQYTTIHHCRTMRLRGDRRLCRTIHPCKTMHPRGARLQCRTIHHWAPVETSLPFRLAIQKKRWQMPSMR